MPDIPTQAAFAFEFERRLDELITWAIANSPNKGVQLTSADFAAARDTLRTIANGGDPLKREPEPEQGGAQYINVSPAPWP